jgi:hypothetical protein
MTSPESLFFDIPRAEWIASNRSASAVWDASHAGFVNGTIAPSGGRCASRTSSRTQRADVPSSSHRDRRAHNPLVAGSRHAWPAQWTAPDGHPRFPQQTNDPNRRTRTPAETGGHAQLRAAVYRTNGRVARRAPSAPR